MNKTVLITGASRGIGKAIAHRFGKAGYSLIINSSKSADALQKLQQELTTLYNIPVLASVGNIGDYEYVSTLFSDIKDKFGGVDILINNAGISHIGLLSDMEPSEWKNLIDINLSSVFYTSKCAVPYMVSKQEGKIINISSVCRSIRDMSLSVQLRRIVVSYKRLSSRILRLSRRLKLRLIWLCRRALMESC